MPTRRVVLKIYVPCKKFHVLSQYMNKPYQKWYRYTTGEISMCLAKKITCPVGHVNTILYALAQNLLPLGH